MATPSVADAKIFVYVPSALPARLARAAQRRGLSSSAYVRSILLRELETEPEEVAS